MSKGEDIKILLGDRATEEFISWLEAIGYFIAPASVSHHGCCCGGLLNHSKTVARELKKLTDKLDLKWDRPESPMVVGLLHDVCKCDDYREVEAYGSWEYNSNKTMDGHGDKSVIMLAGHFPLTEQEAKCIQFHMGSFTDKEQWKYYSQAVNEEPNVLYTHMADMIASQILGA